MKDEDKIILHLCADIGSDSKPYQDAGYNVICIGRGVGVERFNYFSNVHGVIANPVCTEFSVASSFSKKGDYKAGMYLVEHCQRIIKQVNPEFWVIENPYSGHLKDFLGTPDFVYEPWQFGDPWTKKTALWGKFNAPCPLYSNWEDVPKNKSLPTYQGRKKPSIAKMHHQHKRFIKEFDCFEVEDDMSFRSLCPQGFAKAFFNVNR